MRAEEKMLEVLGTGERAGLSDEQLRTLYRLMRRVRALDLEAINLQRQGELAAYAPLTGQEACQVGSTFALEPGDFAFPSYRELGVAVTRGVDVGAYLLAYRGIWHGGMHDPLAQNVAPFASPVGSHLLHAVGWAMGRRKDGASDCSIVYFGEGATSEGDALEAFNFAGVFRAPVVFFCQNNQWAISVPLEKQTAAPVWRKAEAFGFPGLRVDGNDVLAVYQATREALARARADGTPTLIEALTYRVGPHSTADDPSRYRHQDEVERWRRRDPIDRYRHWLEAESVAAQPFFDEVEESVRQELSEIRRRISAGQPVPVEDLFRFTFAELTPDLARQLDEARRLEAGDG
jgi:2-oxoisovalerate dehydrogenase E1 component alpha subunit